MNATQIKRFGHFELLERIGSGGMAEVFKARIRTAEGKTRLLALKKMRSVLSGDEAWVKMFTSEARITAQLRHPNIVRVLDFGCISDTYFLAMEYIDGHDLGWLIARSSELGREIPLPIVAFVLRETCRALHHAHRLRDPEGKLLGLVHRDVSPQNILVSTAGAVKLVDFGIAKAAHRSDVNTTGGKLKGKYCYMAPEQLRDDPVDRRTDIFALGAVAFETLTGNRLFLRANTPATVKAVLEAPIPSPSTLRHGIPPHLDEILRKALARPPRNRFDSARELQVALDDCARDCGGMAKPAQVASWVASLRRGDDAKPQLLTHPESIAPCLTPDPGPAESEWSVDEDGEFFEPSGNQSLDSDPDALLERLSSTENHQLEAFSEDVHDEPTAVGLIDVESLLARRREQVSSGRSAEIPAPPLGKDEDHFAFSGDDELTNASPARTAAVLDELENYPSAEVVISNAMQEDERRVFGALAEVSSHDETLDVFPDKAKTGPTIDVLPKGASGETTLDTFPSNAGGPEDDEVTSPLRTKAREAKPPTPKPPATKAPPSEPHEDAMNDGVGFEEDAETVLDYTLPAGLLAERQAESAVDEAPEFPESTAISFAAAPIPEESKRAPASPTDSLSPDFRLPLHRDLRPPRHSRAWLWIALALLTAGGAGIAAFFLMR